MFVLGQKKALLIALAAALSVALSGCGGGSNEDQSAAEAMVTSSATVETENSLDVASVQSCIAGAGYEVVASGDLPIVERSKAVGVRLPGGGNIMPGDLSAAIFWYASSAKAEAMQGSVAAMFKAISRVDKIVVVYDPMPAQEVMTKIDDCITP